MRRIIDGKAYDTETATLLAEESATCAQSDFQYWREALYRTKSGLFFLEGEGGPMTSWRRASQGGYTSGDGIRYMGAREAREWVEKYANDRFEDIFGPAVEA